MGRGKSAGVWMKVIRRSEEEGGGGNMVGVWVCVRRMKNGEE